MRVSKSQSLNVAKEVRTPSLRLCDFATLRLLLALLFAFRAAANITSSAITGRVIVNGAPAAGVTVTATSAVLQRPRTTITDIRGTYFIDALPPGIYDVTFSRKGLQTLTRRANVELARTARADARLEASEEEETITSTATNPSVTDTTSITTHFDSNTLDRLPVSRDVLSARDLGPRMLSGSATVDDLELDAPEQVGEESLDQVTLIRGAVPVELEEPMVVARTRAPREEFFLALRDTFKGGDHRYEAAGGGRIVPERLWFFAGGWTAPRGGMLKLTTSIGAAHLFTASRIRDTTALRYTGTSTRMATEVLASDETTSGRASFVAGDHVLTAGASDSAVFAADRWAIARWTIYAGLRHDDGTMPRLSVLYDIRGDARRAFVASYNEFPNLRLASLGYAMTLGATGHARIDLFRRDSGAEEIYEAQVESRYRLFDRFEAGGNYAYARDHIRPDQVARAWIGAELPIGRHELGVTLLERVESSAHSDVALRYSIPFTRVGFTAAADLLDVFRSQRTARFWLRVRV